MINTPSLVSAKDPLTKRDIKVASYLNELQVLELLRGMKQKKHEEAQLEQIQKLAGSTDSL